MRDVDFNSFSVGVSDVSDKNEKLKLHARLFEFALHFYHINNFDLKRATTHVMNIIYDGQSLYSSENTYRNKQTSLEKISEELNNINIYIKTSTDIESDQFKTIYDKIVQTSMSNNLLKEVCRFLVLLDCLDLTDIKSSEYAFPIFYILSLSFEKILFKTLSTMGETVTLPGGSKLSRYYIINLFKAIIEEVKNTQFKTCIEQVDESGVKRCVMENNNFILSQTSLQRLVALITIKMVGVIKTGINEADMKSKFLRGEKLLLPQLFFPRNASINIEFIEKYNKESVKKIEDTYKMHCLGGVLYKILSSKEINSRYTLSPIVVDTTRNHMYINGCILFNEYGSIMNTLGCSGVVRHDVTIKGSKGIIFELSRNETFSYKRLMGIPFPFSFSAYEIDSTINPFTGTKSLLLDQSNFNISMYSSLENKELSKLKNGYMDKTTLSPKLHIFHTGFSRFTAMTVGAVLPVKSSLNYVILPSVNEFECLTIRKVKNTLESIKNTSYCIPLYNVIRMDLFIDYLSKYLNDATYPNSISKLSGELVEYFGKELAEYIGKDNFDIFKEV